MSLLQTVSLVDVEVNIVTRRTRAAKAPTAVLVPSAASANHLDQGYRAPSQCNALVDVGTDGAYHFCNAHTSDKQWHLCQRHKKQPVLLVEHVHGNGDGKLMRWCNQCRRPIPLGNFSALSPICSLHTDDPRAGEGRRPLAEALPPNCEVAVAAERAQLSSISVDDAGLVDVATLTKCDVTTCDEEVVGSEGLCGRHTKVSADAGVICMRWWQGRIHVTFKGV